MLEGKIIKFYRERQNIKQKDLGKAICSTTHISKIERGLTEVSKETIQLLANRLGIDMQSEIETYLSLDSLLNKWHESIIMKHNAKAEDIKKQLENVALLQLPEINRLYTLILTRYYLLMNEVHLVKSLIHELDCCSDLSPYEKNMLLHIKGIDGLSNAKYYEAISLLQEIDPIYYNNPEYYYHLAVAYHSLNLRVLAYYYANKSLHFFTELRSFTRIIETETLMLIQVEQEEFYIPSDSEYQRLLEMTDNFNLDHQQAVLYHNYAYQQVRQGNYEKAAEYYKKSMDARDPLSSFYIGSLEGYLNALTKQRIKPNEELLQLANRGISLSEKHNNTTFKHFFHLHKYKLQNEIEKYYHYLEIEAFPYFNKMGYALVVEHYLVKLFDYHMENGNLEQANYYAKSIIEKYRKNHKFV
jgi:HTH-type transcriptional regulator, quorum sensing regulator NprR